MGSLFFFISLAVLVGIVGLLAYYFKSRLAEVESKNLKSLEIIEGIYSQQQQLKQYVLSGGAQAQAQAHASAHISVPVHHSDQYDERIKIVLEENEEYESESESESDTESETDSESDSVSESESEVKKITVDMSFPEECDLEIEEDEPDYIPEDEPEVDIDDQHIEIDEIVVNKLDEDSKGKADENSKVDEDFEITAVKSNDKDNYKKMSTTALKNILHSRGIVTDSARLNKMKKSEIIDLLLVASLAQ